MHTRFDIAQHPGHGGTSTRIGLARLGSTIGYRQGKVALFWLQWHGYAAIITFFSYHDQSNSAIILVYLYIKQHNIYIVAQKTAPLLPSTTDLLRQLGSRLFMARLRRRLPAKQVAARAGMSPMTLRSLERGGSGVTIGAYLAVMQVLGIERDLNLLGQADPVGRELQDAQLPARARRAQVPLLPAVGPATSKAPAAKRPAPQTVRHAKTAPRTARKKAKPAQDAQDWVHKGGFASADALAGLLDPQAAPTARKKRRRAGS